MYNTSTVFQWIFLCHNPEWSGENKDLLKDADAYFKKEIDGLCAFSLSLYI